MKGGKGGRGEGGKGKYRHKFIYNSLHMCVQLTVIIRDRPGMDSYTPKFTAIAFLNLRERKHAQSGTKVQKGHPIPALGEAIPILVRHAYILIMQKVESPMHNDMPVVS